MSSPSEAWPTSDRIFNIEDPVTEEGTHETYKRSLFSARGIECGYFAWTFFNSLEEQGERYGCYMDRIPCPNKWPLALFENLEVAKRFQRRGIGRRGVKQFLQDARDRGAVCALLKVGWGTRNCERERIWKTHFYASEGFIELESRSFTEPVLMYHPLTTP